jgi:hypothetical protein
LKGASLHPAPPDLLVEFPYPIALLALDRHDGCLVGRNRALKILNLPRRLRRVVIAAQFLRRPSWRRPLILVAKKNDRRWRDSNLRQHRIEEN